MQSLSISIRRWRVSANILDTLLKWAPRDRILFGTGYSYAFESRIEYFTKGLERYEMDGEMRGLIYRGMDGGYF